MGLLTIGEGGRVKKTREKAGLTREELFQMTGISVVRLTEIEEGSGDGADMMEHLQLYHAFPGMRAVYCEVAKHLG